MSTLQAFFEASRRYLDLMLHDEPFADDAGFSREIDEAGVSGTFQAAA